jgi:hypothetical protein
MAPSGYRYLVADASPQFGGKASAVLENLDLTAKLRRMYQDTSA